MNEILTTNKANITIIHRLINENYHVLQIQGDVFECIVSGNFQTDKVSLKISRIAVDQVKAMSNAFWKSITTELDSVDINKDNFNLFMNLVVPFCETICELSINPKKLKIDEIQSHISQCNNNSEMETILIILEKYFNNN